MKTLLLAACASTLAIASAHAATVVNAGFENTTNGLGQINYNTQAVGWTVPNGGYAFIMDSTADSLGSDGQYGNLKLWGPANGSMNGFTASPTGGNFLAIDGAFQEEPVQQMITGLVAGQRFNVGFDWAGIQQYGFTGDQTEQFKVSFGGQDQYTAVYSNPSHGFSGWRHETFTFTATGPSQLLSFLAIGTPSGVPPFSLLDGVSVASVPEPATWAMMIGGFAVIGASMRRRKAAATYA